MAAEALEQSMLESKDKEQLLAIAQALGITVTARAAKATLINRILETTGAGATPAAAEQAPPATTETATTETATEPAEAKGEEEIILGPDGEPLANWEMELVRRGEAPRPAPPAPSAKSGAAKSGGAKSIAARSDAARSDADGDDEGDDDGDDDGTDLVPGESRNARRRRRRRNKSRTGEGEGGQPGPGNVANGANGANGGQAAQPGPMHREDIIEAPGLESVEVDGYLDLRDEGYGFLRVHGYLASRDDAYVPVKLTRQFGLRKGDHVTGLSRPAGRNEKNPALLEIRSVNGRDPDEARDRRRFEDLTALFPDTKLRLENVNDPTNVTARIIDLVSPIGKGQRGIIVSPPKAGKTTIMKTIASAIEANHPEVKLIVLLIDERPEEVTDMRRTVKGEVIASTFDRPSEEHTHVAELALEKAKRLVEMGDDVVMIVDGITRLSRAYNLAAPPSGRILSGGIDAGALYPPKRFFGAARNCEEGGSLTILATALVETNSRMDEAIFEEFKGTGNMELRLDRRLAERRIFPAIDVDASSTRHEELLFDRKQLQQVWKLRRVLSGLAAEGSAGPGLELLIDRLRSFKNNAEFLAEIAKQPG